MTTLIKYAIRRKSDGFYIPQPLGRNGRGGSHMEPEDPNLPETEVRLFKSEAAARISMNAWLKGRWITEHGHDPGHPGNDWESEDYEETRIEPVEGRNKEDMEVVPVEVVLPSKTKPVWHLVGAVFIGEALWGDVVEKEHPHYHTPEEIADGKHVKCSRILWRTDDHIFETANSIYVVKEWVPNGRMTIPLELTRKPQECS
jgi:hypothetical protein